MYQVEGDFADTLWGPGMIRFKTDTWAGPVTIHCHILDHEDRGAMATIHIVNGCDNDYGDYAQDNACDYVDTCGQFDVITTSPIRSVVVTNEPTEQPTMDPTDFPTMVPSPLPSDSPIVPGSPTRAPSLPTPVPTDAPSMTPTNVPTMNPTNIPTYSPSGLPSDSPVIGSNEPSEYPTFDPTIALSIVQSTSLIVDEENDNIDENDAIVQNEEILLWNPSTYNDTYWIIFAGLILFILVLFVVSVCFLKKQSEERTMRKTTRSPSIKFHVSPQKDGFDIKSETLFGAPLGGHKTTSKTRLPHVTDLFEKSIIDVGLQKINSPIAIRGVKHIQVGAAKHVIPAPSTEFTIGEINSILEHQQGNGIDL